jgi:hypothetical protein
MCLPVVDGAQRNATVVVAPSHSERQTMVGLYAIERAAHHTLAAGLGQRPAPERGLLAA